MVVVTAMKYLLFLSVFALTACSSVPDFRPSKPVEEASSLEDAIGICGEYKIKGDQNSSGLAKPARVVTLVPWIRCFETVFRKFPDSKKLDSFVALLRALQARHDSVLQPDAPVVNWPSMNAAVATSLTHLRSKKLPFSKVERRAIEAELPGYATYLAETGRFGDKPHRAEFTTDDLAELRKVTDLSSKELAAPALDDKTPVRPLPLNEEQVEYCKKYKQLLSTAHTAEELSDYKRVLESQTYADVSNANERAMQSRVNDRYEKAKKEATDLKAELDKQLPELQAKSAWFRNVHCLRK